MVPSADPLGILAGGGVLPRLLIQSCAAQGRAVFVVAFKGQCDADTVAGVDHAWVRLGAAGTSIQVLKDHGVRDLVMAGHIRRPSMAALRPDVRALAFLAGGVLNKGDDGLLRTIMSGLERDEGFRLFGAHELCPDLLAAPGALAHRQPDPGDRVDIDIAVRGALDLGAADKGQAAVAVNGQLVAVEGPDGTDAMLAGLAGVAQPGTDKQTRAGVLAKMSKPGQDRRADLPTIGQKTIENAHAAGLKGVVVEAGGAIIVDRDAVRKSADDLGLFVVGVAR